MDSCFLSMQPFSFQTFFCSSLWTLSPAFFLLFTADTKRQRFVVALLPQLFGNNCPGHTTREPQVGFKQGRTVSSSEPLSSHWHRWLLCRAVQSNHYLGWGSWGRVRGERVRAFVKQLVERLSLRKLTRQSTLYSLESMVGVARTSIVHIIIVAWMMPLHLPNDMLFGTLSSESCCHSGHDLSCKKPKWPFKWAQAPKH